MWIEGNFYKYSVAIILVLLIVLLLYYTSPFFSPVLWFVTAVFLPILFATFLYYILRPLIMLLDKWLPDYLSILIVYAILSIVIAAFIFIFAPEAINAISQISPDKLEALKTSVNKIVSRIENYLPFNFPSFEDTIFSSLSKINVVVSKLLINLLATLAGIAISLVLTPFVLFYFLKDDHLFAKSILRFVPSKFQEEVQKILQDIDSTLSEFIQAQMILASIVGFCLLCGYSLIGLPHALSLALFAVVFYVIPFLGTFIAIIPALIVALSISFSMMFKVLLVMFVAHFLEANILTPRLMSQRLKIHPLTIILLLLAAGSLYGVLGLLLVTPTYAVLKVVSWNLYKIVRLHYVMAKTKAQHDAQDEESSPSVEL